MLWYLFFYIKFLFCINFFLRLCAFIQYLSIAHFNILISTFQCISKTSCESQINIHVVHVFECCWLIILFNVLNWMSFHEMRFEKWYRNVRFAKISIINNMFFEFFINTCFLLRRYQIVVNQIVSFTISLSRKLTWRVSWRVFWRVSIISRFCKL